MDSVSVSLGSEAGTIPVCRDGHGIDFSEEKAKQILLQNEIDIDVDMGQGSASATCLGPWRFVVMIMCASTGITAVKEGFSCRNCPIPSRRRC